VRSDRGLELPDTVPGELRTFELDDGASFSGHERNHLFLNRGDRFLEASSVSGLDDLADGRAFGILDFDRDGWSDVAVVSANAPLLQLFRNDIAAVLGEDEGNVIAVRLVGGNREAAPSDSWSARDGYGARVEVAVDGRMLLREHVCGGGMAAQNSATMLVGIGAADAAGSIEITWPSGRTSRVGRIEAGSLVTVFENPADSPAGNALDVRPYRVEAPARVATGTASGEHRETAGTFGLDTTRESTKARINMYTTMATWCMSCLFEIPHLELLRAEFSNLELAMFGVPVDPADEPQKLRDYVEENNPPYSLLIDLPTELRASVDELVENEVGADLLPVTVLTDGKGTILSVAAGTPTVSALRKLMGSTLPRDHD